MINQFVWSEILLYLLPFFNSFFALRILKTYLKPYSITAAMTLLPTWLMVIQGFSLLCFNYNIIPLLSLLTIFIIALYLYDYLKQISHFFSRVFLKNALHLVFISWTFFLVGMMLTRIVSYFLI